MSAPRLCECGCGKPTRVAKKTARAWGHVVGQPVRYIPGHSLMGVHTPRPVEERFWPKVDKRGPGECWPWKAARDEHGYGMISSGGHSGRLLRAHRISYEIHIGEVPADRRVLHRCDNPPCCNPKHLFLGTQAENMADMVRKGRSASGERHSQAKLTAADVEEIRRLLAAGELSQDEIGARFGIAGTTVSQINTGKRWRGGATC